MSVKGLASAGPFLYFPAGDFLSAKLGMALLDKERLLLPRRNVHRGVGPSVHPCPWPSSCVRHEVPLRDGEKYGEENHSWYLISSGGYAKRFGEITMKITLKYTVVIHNVMRTTVICFCLRLMEIKCPLRTVSSQACDGSARSMNGSRSGVFRARSNF